MDSEDHSFERSRSPGHIGGRRSYRRDLNESQISGAKQSRRLNDSEERLVGASSSSGSSAKASDSPAVNPVSYYDYFLWHMFFISVLLLHIINGAVWRATVVGINPNDGDCKDRVKNLRTRFPNQEPNFWLKIDHELSGVLKETSQPSIVMFLYNDSRAVDFVLNSIVNVTKDCLKPSRDPIVLTAAELNNEEVKSDYGILIQRYRPQLSESHIMLVNDLQNISPVASRMFHEFCDIYSPIVERYVVFFTLYYTADDHRTATSANDLASNLLTKLWDSYIPKDALQPLIARITELTVFLKAP